MIKVSFTAIWMALVRTDDSGALLHNGEEGQRR
jgi:hypothetical protein